MTALSGNIPVIRDWTLPPGTKCRQPRATHVFRPGGLVARRVGSDIAEVPLSTAPRADLVCEGCFVADYKFTAATSADSAGGSLDENSNPESITIREGCPGWFDTGAGSNEITNLDLRKICYMYDDNTLYRTSMNGQLSPAGLVEAIGTGLYAGKIKLRMLPEIFLFGEAGAGVGAGAALLPMARAVVTSLAANTESAGVMTADANGALGAQDGVTLVAGDTVLIPEGTTNLDAAADAGPWEVVQVGNGSTPFILRRPAWWADGAAMPQGAIIAIGGEGTLFGGSLWRTFADSNDVVGTDAPLFWPNQVTQNVTLASGTLASALTTIPVRSATKSGIGIMSTPTTAPHANTRVWRVSALTAGAIGTASIQIVAETAPGTTNASDVGTYNITVRNW